jgi:biopolymer transport protein TolQ
MNTDLSILHLVANASTLVQLVMLALLAASVLSWTIMFKKRKELLAFKQRLEQTEVVHQQADFGKINEWLLAQRDQNGIVPILRLGLRDALQCLHHEMPLSHKTDYIRQTMQTQLTKHAQELEEGVPFLASVGSVSPYVGLFGTVWGIMMAFKALGSSTAQATLAMVAPGIAEALIATAMGLFAAIPAVIAYNRFQYQLEMLLERYERLITQFCHHYLRYIVTQTDTTE